MSKYVQRVLSALRWVDTVEDNRRKDMTWAVLVTILHNMVRRPGSQTDVLATDSYLAGALEINHRTSWETVDRLTESGVLETITGTPAGQAVRDRRKSTTPLPENARVVRLGREREAIGDGTGGGHERPQGQERQAIGGERQAIELSTDVITSPRRGELSIGDTNYSRGLSTDKATVQDLRGWLESVSPSSEVWKQSHSLGPKAMRTYGYLVSASKPVLPRHLRDDLGISRKRATELLKDLAAHGLAQRPSDGSPGWVAGPNTPDALQTPQMPSQPQEAPSMPDCQDCHAYAEHGLPCPCSDVPAPSLSAQPATPESHAPSTTPAKPLKWQRPNDGSRFVLYSEDGQTLTDHRPPQTGDVVFALVDSATGYVQALRVDGSRLYADAFLTPGDEDYPKAVAAAAR